MVKGRKKYYNFLNYVKVMLCFAIFLYHLGLLKGGYLAVCSFFVISGFLAYKSLSSKKKISLKDYYLSRFKKIYLPLVIVTLSSLVFTSLFKDIIWVSLKNETTSVLLGYNNFFQISANMDYFARHLSSPFMHLWYIAILLQFDLIFPLVYLGFKKISSKNKIYPLLSIITISIISYGYFVFNVINNNINVAYYSTLSRIFSLLLGVLVGYYIKHYHSDILKKCLKYNKLNLALYLFILIILFIKIDSSSSYFAISILLVSIITCRIISYTMTLSYHKVNKVFKYLADISYEIYLVSYPIIYLFSYININKIISFILIFILTIVISILLHFALSSIKNKVMVIFKYIVLISICIITIYGGYLYIKAKDHTLEMKQLEYQLEQNELLLQDKLKEYEENSKKANNDWMETLKDLENGQNNLANVVSNLNVVGIGDSVMLGAVPDLYLKFKNGYFDAKISRTAWVVNGIIKELDAKGILGNPVVLNLGANGDCTIDCKKTIMQSLGDREVFWLNVTNDSDVHVNNGLNTLASSYKNLHIIDWNSISKGHYDYFVADGIHLTSVGRQAYTNVIYDAIYNFYLDKFNVEKDEILKKHDEEEKRKISFYGNDLLLNVIDKLETIYNGSKIIVNKDFDFNSLRDNLITSKDNNTLTYNIVFMFDSSIDISKDEYLQLLDICKDHNVYILSTEDISYLTDTGAHIIDFNKDINIHSDYLLFDKIHLSDIGNEALVDILSNYVKISN